MARAGAALFGAGGLLSLGTLVVPHWKLAHEVEAGVVAGAALPVSALLYLFARRISEWLIRFIVLFSIALVSFGIQFLGRGAQSAAAGALYAWILVYVFYFFPWRQAFFYLGAVAVAYAVTLWAEHDPAGPAQWLFIIGTASGAGIVVGILVGRLRALAGTDGLTGLANRRTWEETLDRELARAFRHHVPVAIAVIDLDDFKALNDRSGHQAGDRVLKELSALWTEAIREEDVLARPGGDEFGLVFPNCDQDHAREILDRLRAKTPTITFSAGLATWDGSEQGRSLLERADIALYRAKNRGGGRTVVAGAPGLSN